MIKRAVVLVGTCIFVAIVWLVVHTTRIRAIETQPLGSGVTVEKIGDSGTRFSIAVSDKNLFLLDTQSRSILVYYLGYNPEVGNKLFFVCRSRFEEDLTK